MIVARQLLSALAYLHEHDVVHRDIKLNNVLVTSIEPLVVKIGDLSLANTTDECDVWPSAGTICTKAPESMHDHPFSITEKSDIYSLGAALFTAATGQYPFCQHTVAVGDKHKCDRCEDRAHSTNEDDHTSLGDEGSHYTEHVCVSGTMREALQALSPEQSISNNMSLLLLAMCAFNPNDRPSASVCLRFEVFQFRLRPQQQMDNKNNNDIVNSRTKRAIGQSSMVRSEQQHQQKKKKSGEKENKENEIQSKTEEK